LRSIPAKVDGRSQQEPTVDPSKSRRSILVRADGRSQQKPTVDPNKNRRLIPTGDARCRSPSPASETLCLRWCVTARRKRLREVAIRGTVCYPVGSRFFTPAPGKAAGSDGIRRPHGSRGTACSDDGPRKCRGLVVITDFSDGYRLGKPYPKKSLPDM
jgi:hypothetical protein